MLVGDAELDSPPNAIRIEPHCIDVLSEATTSAESLRSRALSLYANAWAAALPDNVQAAIKEFRAGMHLLGLERDLAYWDNDWVAWRFLKARDYDVEVALQFFRDDFIWREARQLNEIVQTGGGAVPKLFAEFRVPELQELKAVRMITFHKTDRLGQPIAYDRPTHATIREMHKVTSLERLMEYAVWFQEATVVYRLPAASLAAGRLVTQITVIIDVSGFALKNFNAEMRAVLKALTSISANHYPETMQRTFIVNAPLAFRVVWRFLKIILPPKVVEAIRICGGPHDYLPVLERDVCNRSQIPTFLGGDDASFVDFAHEIGPWAEHLPKLV